MFFRFLNHREAFEILSEFHDRPDCTARTTLACFPTDEHAYWREIPVEWKSASLLPAKTSKELRRPTKVGRWYTDE